MSVAIIAGSGLGDLARILHVESRLPFHMIPGVGEPTVAGHAGEILSGQIRGKACQLVLGRRHFYEGDAEPIHRLIDFVVARGAGLLIVTSAAGSLRRTLTTGELVVAHDFLDRQNRPAAFAGDGASPARAMLVRGIKPDPRATRLFERAATDAGVPWHRGTIACASGPTYESPADVEALQFAGADVATMSGAPEVARANELGIPVVAVALVTNPCTGIDASRPSHQSVLEAANWAARGLTQVIEQFVMSY